MSIRFEAAVIPHGKASNSRATVVRKDRRWLSAALACTVFFGSCQAVLAICGRRDADGFRAWSVQATNSFAQVAIRNDNAVADADGVTCRWAALRDGWQVAAGTFSLMTGRKSNIPLAAGSLCLRDVPRVVRTLAENGGEMSLRVVFSVEDGDGEYLELATDQIDFPRIVPPGGLGKSLSQVKVRDDGSSLSFDADGVTYGFCRKTGELRSICTGFVWGTEWLRGQLAPILPATPGGDALTCAEAEVVGLTNAVGEASFAVLSRWRLPQEKYRDEAVAVVRHFTVRGDGALVMRSRIVRDGHAVDLSETGFRMRLAVDDPLVECLARTKHLARHQFSAMESDRSLGGVRSVSVDAGWDHLSIAAGGAPFELSVGRESGGTVFSVLAKTNELEVVVRPEKAAGAVGLDPLRLPEVPLRSMAALSKTIIGSRAITVDLGREREIVGFRLCSETASQGASCSFCLETSLDGCKWTRDFFGDFPQAGGWRKFTLPSPLKMRYGRVGGNGESAGKDFVRVTEIEFEE